MSRSTRAVVSVLLLGGFASVPAAPIPRDATPVLFLATKVGAKWQYDVDGVVETHVVTAAEWKADTRAWVVAVGRDCGGGEVEPYGEWAVSDRGLFLLVIEGAPCLSPRCYLQLPHRNEAEWDLLPRHAVRCVALPRQRVTVPAGTFDAVGVAVYAGDELVETRWFALGVGLVKEVVVGRETRVLKSFTPAK